MIESGFNGKNYYDNYQGVDLGRMYDRLKNMRMPRGEFAEIGAKEKISILVLGSATSKNLSRIAQIDSFLRPGKVERDRAVIIDLNMYPLAEHKGKIISLGEEGESGASESTPDFPLPKFEFARADMRELPFRERKFELAISDYTFNYLDKFEDVDKTFEEMARTMSPRGVVLISVKGNEKYPPGKKIPEGAKNELQVVTTQGGIKINCFPLSAYLDSSERHGFELAASDTVGTDICAVLRKSEKSLFI